jgi:hypothetical protein
MVSDEMKLKDARTKAKAAGCFIIATPDGRFVLYRECTPRNVRIGSRAKINDMVRLVTKACDAR